MKTNVTNKSMIGQHLKTLVQDIGERPVGSPGNQQAVDYAAQVLQSLDWKVQLDDFECIDWEDASVQLLADGHRYTAYASPYSPGCDVRAELVVADTMEELQNAKLHNRILLMTGQLSKEQIMPKNFIFYNPEEHQKLISLLEEKKPLAIICATGPGEGLSKGLDPFPVFEDGDFHIPSVYMKETESEPLIKCQGQEVTLVSKSRRIPSTAQNLVARKSGSDNSAGRLILCGHIDAKKNTPGAVDNATGVAVLLALAERLQQYTGAYDLELVAFNGEDYYAIPGQMLYLHQNEGNLKDIKMVINIDGAGHIDSRSALSFYNLSEMSTREILETAGEFNTIVPGEEWYEGDHSMFLQQGIPCMAVTSSNLHEAVMNISHTPEDSLDKVNQALLEDLAAFLHALLTT